MLTWEDTIEIVKNLRIHHPEASVDDLSLEMIYQWTIEIPEFSDDHELVNENILVNILSEWYEEVNPI